MDEQTAWACFQNTGKVQDYLIYSQCRQGNAAHGQEDANADQDRWPGDPGSLRG